MSQPVHVAIVGSGAGAMAAALQASSMGARITVVEHGEIGGTCVNVGCIPSKLMLRAAHVAQVRRTSAFDDAIAALATVTIDRPQLGVRQRALIAGLREAKYASILRDDDRISVVHGHARFLDARTLAVAGSSGPGQHVSFDRCIIATGARPAVPLIAGLPGTPFWTSTDALAGDHIPPRLLVIGGSAVAVELAQAFARLGSRVTVLARSSLLSREDAYVGEQLAAAFRDEGMDIRLHAGIRQVRQGRGLFSVDTATGAFEGEQLLVAAGRVPNTDALGLDAIGMEQDASGAIVVDQHLRTSVARISAAGDCTTLPQYVYVAAAAGVRAAENALGGNRPLDLAVLPAVTFTDPEVATVGLSEAAAARAGLEVEARTLPLAHVPRGLVNADLHGGFKLVAERASGRLVGVQIVAPGAGEVIQAAALALRARLTVDEVADLLCPYLTMAEGLKLAAQSFSRDMARLSCCAG